MKVGTFIDLANAHKCKIRLWSANEVSDKEYAVVCTKMAEQLLLSLYAELTFDRLICVTPIEEDMENADAINIKIAENNLTYASSLSYLSCADRLSSAKNHENLNIGGDYCV